MRLFTRRFAQLWGTAALVGALALSTSGSAGAATYDGADPASTYCGGTTSTPASANLTSPRDGTYVGTVYLRYNSGCRTVWAKIVLANPQGNCGAGYGDDCAVAGVVRNSDGAELECTVPVGATSCYSRMLNDAGVTSYAWAIRDSSGSGIASATTASY